MKSNWLTGVVLAFCGIAMLAFGLVYTGYVLGHALAVCAP